MALPIRVLKQRQEARKPQPVAEDSRGRTVPPALDPEAPEIAGASLLVNRYPAAIDDVPAITDNDTPLSGIFYNYLGLMLEAAMAELGTFSEIKDGKAVPFLPDNGLMDYLGAQLANSVSNWRSFNKTFGGNEAGQVYGFIKRQHSSTAAGYANEQTGSAITQQGVHPAGKEPALFGEVIGTLGLPGGPQTYFEFALGIMGGVRGEVTGLIGTSIQYRYRGCPGTILPGAPTGTYTQAVNLLLAYPVEGP